MGPNVLVHVLVLVLVIPPKMLEHGFPRHFNVFTIYNPPKCGCLVPVLTCGQADDYSKVLAREKELEKCSGHR